ncbi:Acetyltransferase (GNAT) domain-containing protein [Cyclobacterium lianum]|uniref:Acetyltransferase (GNAT) domain-containing protein n=1 Tax=Cyclobacterium lianum TaxID=388280 RepID=A0A1M7N8F8_9BACT|nr:GNAT family N-acetyltransferase [Cyclobacterium lianum]SHM99873.1 Acetyltransferase (GNAT) domain-containing protein [Cyclobacterium lianum]
MESEIYIKHMQEEDLPAAMALKAAEGWNQTEADWKLFLGGDPRLCLVARKEGKTVATVTAFAYDTKLAWIGMMLVQQEFRRRGISKRLMLELIDRLSDRQTIKLDATPAGQAVYEKLGFRKEYSLFRWTRKPAPFSEQRGLPASVFPLESVGPGEIASYDTPIFGTNREIVLSHVMATFPEGAYVAKDQERINGFLLSRKGSKYLQLGPMVAENDGVAKKLLRSAILEWGTGMELVLDMASERLEMNSWLKEQGFTQQRELVRMYLHANHCPGLPHKYYLITGPELG